MVLYPLINVIWRRRWIGAERIPALGPAILAVNHISYADPFVIGRCVWDAGRLPRFLAKASLFTVPVIGRILVGAGQIPVYRGTIDADEALKGAVAALGRGEMVIIYPEGTVTRDPDFWPMQPKTGVARLAMLAPEVPVIPIAQWGPQEFLDFYARRFRPLPRKAVSVSVGVPMDLSGWTSLPTAGTPGAAAEAGDPTAGQNQRALHELSEHIMAEVTGLLAGLRGEAPPPQLYPRPTGVDSRARDAIRRRDRRLR